MHALWGARGVFLRAFELRKKPADDRQIAMLWDRFPALARKQHFDCATHELGRLGLFAGNLLVIVRFHRDAVRRLAIAFHHAHLKLAFTDLFDFNLRGHCVFEPPAPSAILSPIVGV